MTLAELWNVLTVLDNPTKTLYMQRWHAREAVIRAIEAYEQNDPYDVTQPILPLVDEEVRAVVREIVGETDP